MLVLGLQLLFSIRKSQPAAQIRFVGLSATLASTRGGGEGGTPYIRLIGMIVVSFRGCNRRFSIFRGCSSEIYLKKIKLVFVRV